MCRIHSPENILSKNCLKEKKLNKYQTYKKPKSLQFKSKKLKQCQKYQAVIKYQKYRILKEHQNYKFLNAYQ